MLQLSRAKSGSEKTPKGDFLKNIVHCTFLLPEHFCLGLQTWRPWVILDALGKWSLCCDRGSVEASDVLTFGKVDAKWGALRLHVMWVAEALRGRWRGRQLPKQVRLASGSTALGATHIWCNSRNVSVNISSICCSCKFSCFKILRAVRILFLAPGQ